MTNNEILTFLNKHKDANYQKFSSSLIPGCNNMLGVRIPTLRKLAKSIVKGNNIENYLKNTSDNTFEELMLQGLVIGYSKENIDTIISYCIKFVSKINNWSICDSFCNSLKISQKYPDEMWDYITSYQYSNKEYELRFMIVMCLSYFINEKYINKIFSIIGNIKSTDYYVEMAIAWLLSVCYIKYPEETLTYLKMSSVSTFCYNKALQKILESYKVSDKDKVIIKKLKK